MGERVMSDPVAALFGDYGELLVVAVSIVFVLLFARFCTTASCSCAYSVCPLSMPHRRAVSF